MRSILAVLSKLVLCGAVLLTLARSSASAQNQWTDWWLNGTVADLENGWRYYPIKGAQCRHGTDTGIAVRIRPGAKKVVITMQGGGGCFSGVTCAGNVSEYGEDEARAAASGGGLGTRLDVGIWNRSPEKSNELGGYSEVFIPYCTGDLHAGDNVTYVNGVFNKQYFVGYNNTALYFRYIVDRFIKKSATPIDEVLLSGFSAGAFGATLNAPQLRKLLPASVPMTLLNDSGPLFDSKNGTLLASCQQERWWDTWGVGTLLRDAGCTSCTRGNWANPFFQTLLTSYRSVPVAFTSSTYDAVIRAFMGYTNFACGHDPSEAEYTQGLLDLRAQMIAARSVEKNVATFFVAGTSQHCTIQNDSYFTYKTAESTSQNPDRVQTWVEALTFNGTGPHTPADYTHRGVLTP